MKIEFFHDVICSFCFPMSYRMRKIQKTHPEIEVIHRSFALAKDAHQHELMFGSHEKAKNEVLTHWEHANQNDDLHRFNIQGMREADFLFPTSMNGLLATKAAETVGGSNTYWDLFDALQKALFVNSQDISDLSVIEATVKNVKIDFDAWQTAFQSPTTKEKVEADFALAEAYGLRGVPFLVIDGKYGLNGAQPLEQIEQAIESAKEKEKISLESLNTDAGGSCRMEDGKQICD